MPNMTPGDGQDIIDELYGDPGDKKRSVEEEEEKRNYPGAYAVVNLVVERSGGTCSDRRGQVIVEETRGQTNKPTSEAVQAAQAEVARLQGCADQSCYLNPDGQSNAIGCKIERDGTEYYSVVGFISQDGQPGGIRIRRVLANTNQNFRFLNYQQDSPAIKDNC